jgi:hypothetical protein
MTQRVVHTLQPGRETPGTPRIHGRNRCGRHLGGLEPVSEAVCQDREGAVHRLFHVPGISTHPSPLLGTDTAPNSKASGTVGTRRFERSRARTTVPRPG